MMPAEILLTTDAIIFIGTVCVAIIAIMLFYGSIDKRVTVLEKQSLTKDEFAKEMKELRIDVKAIIQEGLSNCKYKHEAEN
jgi:hypothetical protein